MSDYEILREQMVARHIEARGIRTPGVLAAMRAVPRERFVPPGREAMAYDDLPLPIGAGQTISQPYIVAYMIDALGLESGDKVLEVGTGSGYAAAVLAEIAAEVYTIERIRDLAERSARLLDELGYDNVVVRHDDGATGWPEEAPFDGIVVAAGAPDVPEVLKQQLATGARLVIPVGGSLSHQALLRITRLSEHEFREENLTSVRFVPLLGRHGWPEHVEPGAGAAGERIRVRDADVLPRIADACEPFQSPESADLGPLMERIGEARLVMIGAASHGSAEFYRLRQRISQALIEQKGFGLIAIEADRRDAARVDHYVRHVEGPPTERTAFARFPSWMWRNREVRGFVEWLRGHNERRSAAARVAFHGLDLYSLYSSIRAVLGCLDDVDPTAVGPAREAWNLRDTHMFETLRDLLEQRGPAAKAIVWAHNSHVGDAAATDMGARGETNLGRLSRAAFGPALYTVGFGTDHGTVAVASDWDGPMQIKEVPAARRGSIEKLMHDVGLPGFLLPLRDLSPLTLKTHLALRRLQRAIGVVYRPETEPASQYFEASLPRQFDEYVWINETSAVGPFETAELQGVPDTHRFGV